MAEPAPFFRDVAEGPENVRAVWATASDGVRLRLATWPGGDKGTVLLFPGRTEYVEKYGRTAADLVGHGFTTIAIDWRGQGLSDRLMEDRDLGHVGKFLDYQRDVAELLAAARDQDLPKPYFLLAHSMGGCIGMRALLQGLPVGAAVFSAPMWGIMLSRRMRPVAWALSFLGRHVWGGRLLTPGTTRRSYVSEAPFADNMLTTDPDMYAYMQRQVSTYPELSLGGPSLHWLHEALAECRRKADMQSPDIPALTFLGSNERVVDPAPIHARTAGWPGSRLRIIDTAEHEVLMERPEIRSRVLAETATFFNRHG